MPVNLYPAIDIRGGRAVRLRKGDFDAETAYDADPLDAAKRWVDGGAKWLHVVDLDGAKDGAQANADHLRRIAELGVPVQTGGGLRTADAVAAAFANGVERVILGTAALESPELVDELVARYGGGRIVVSLDAKGGLVTTRGWVHTTDQTVVSVATSLAERGVERIVFTDVNRDGMGEGTDLTGMQELLALDAIDVIASGGIGALSDIQDLVDLQHPRLDGIIVGRALYEHAFTLPEALGIVAA
ncbi:MAG: 1-(5-phosphoribosyl)-5-[(5-phosphoribosylamino)methylideneamino]imidazole-4-carboxamide isomerase [Solirubrobacteraceae bacterium]|nr:1-(5-phosphoribosyl)-5-[(5-phosphoribosylamino)methylideneamino]imidazole-4-carboxamide isomerase [Solirubrobacteraceae bacterium]